MTLEQWLVAFDTLGAQWRQFTSAEDSAESGDSAIWSRAMHQAYQANPWFTPSNVKLALNAWGKLLTKENLTKFLQPYSVGDQSQTVAVIMAGNLPLVGLHDLLCTVLAGHKALIKPSSEDSVLMSQVVKTLIELEPNASQYLHIANGPLKNFDRVIATGSNNTARYFEMYFGKYPHVIRKSRTSLGVLTGRETPEQLYQLGIDITRYFGMGCRNVSHLLVPEGYDFSAFFEAIFPLGDIVNHNKYANNYDYHKAVFLLERIPFLDNNFLMLRHENNLQSPLSVVHYSHYLQQDDITNYIIDNRDHIQCIVGSEFIPFGQAQEPQLWDYADNIDTMQFLLAD
ncbi:MAG TPA: acyl-CoA reductase [Luteibaculaceae bacterium]|nr:acyl-CoA reductase [Luteibaculaceae bacterium]